MNTNKEQKKQRKERRLKNAERTKRNRKKKFPISSAASTFTALTSTL